MEEAEEEFDQESHVIPEKGEHHFEEEEYENAEHLIPHKGEHHEPVHELPKDKWKADYHGKERVSEHDRIERPKEVEHAQLKPKEPEVDDPRLNIP